jgi:putative ABC transport system permease protein
MTIAFLVSIPLSWALTNLWLREFANRIELGPGTFLFGVGVISLIALIVIGSQTLKAALDNPVDNLHTD